MKPEPNQILKDMTVLLSAEAVKLKAQGKTDMARGIALAKLLFEEHIARFATPVESLGPQLRHEDFPESGTLCACCHQPQYKTPSGDCCVNGHGGWAPLTGQELAAVLRAKPHLRKHIAGGIGFAPPPPIARRPAASRASLPTPPVPNRRLQ